MADPNKDEPPKKIARLLVNRGGKDGRYSIRFQTLNEDGMGAAATVTVTDVDGATFSRKVETDKSGVGSLDVEFDGAKKRLKFTVAGSAIVERCTLYQ